jgi:isoquinoline 1-oxidoreductase beta subunit
MDIKNVSRRRFIVGAGAFSVGVAFGPLAALNDAQAADAATAAAASGGFRPVAWVSISPDNIATIYSPASEMGQGTMTAIPMIFAEEMNLDWSRVRVEQAPTDAKRFGNPAFGGGLVTGSSRTIKGYYESLRLAGLQARLVMIDAAAQAWKVPANEIRAEKSTLVHTPTGRRVTYGEIAATAQAPAALPKVDKTMLKPMSEFTIIGTDPMRVEVASKADGTAVYGLDIRRPGMVWAAIRYAPVQGEKPVKVNDTAARAIKGVKQVVTLPQAVAVVADSFATARKARDLLEVTWTTTSQARTYDSDVVLKEYVKRAENLDDAGTVWHKSGDVAAAQSGVARTFKATYTSDHVAQFTMEPMNCTALVTGDTIELWVPSQVPSVVIGTVAAAAGFKPENIKVNITLLGGGYGRRAEADYTIEAAQLAKTMPGVPVQMIWTREDDFQRSKPRPLTAHHVVAGVDGSGKLQSLRHRTVSESIYARTSPAIFKAAGGKDAPVMEGADGVYGIPATLVEHVRDERGVDVSYWRGVGAGYQKFVMETLVDEIAAETKQDPLKIRMDLTQGSPRAQAVLRTAADMAGWSTPRANGRALGMAFSDAWNTFIAMVVEVSMKDGKPVVHQMWAAVDCGHAIMPRNVRAQVEGAAIFGLSAALGETLSYKAGQVQQSNLTDYPILRADATPLVEIKVLPTDNPPGGIGEVGLPPVAPAVANAMARLTGKRVRSLPFPQVA